MGKSPKHRSSFELQKVPRTAQSPDSYLKKLPSWRISKIEMVEHYSWHSISKEELDRIRVRLANFETMPWVNILGLKSHLVEVHKIIKLAQDRLQTLHIYEDSLLSLRLTGRERVWAILNDGVASLLWWDPNHEICPWLGKDN